MKDIFIYFFDYVKLYVYYVVFSCLIVKIVVIVYGYIDNVICMMMIGYLYNKKLDFNIFLLDLCDIGLSGGNVI